MRFTLCHELGHIIMHQDAMVAPDMEKQADEFAAEFLMPEIEIRPYLTDLSLEKLATLKQFWKVSMAALLKRATDLGVITHRQARTLWMQMGKAGYRTREPVELDLPVEKPSLEKEIVDTYIEDMGYTISELGKLLCLSTKEVMNDYIGSEQRLRDKERKAIVGEAERIIRKHPKKWGE